VQKKPSPKADQRYADRLRGYRDRREGLRRQDGMVGQELAMKGKPVIATTSSGRVASATQLKCILIREAEMNRKSGMRLSCPILAILMLLLPDGPAMADEGQRVAALAPVVAEGVPADQVGAITTRLQDIIGVDHDLVAESRYVTVAQEVARQLGIETCDSEACLRETLMATDADILYFLTVAREGYFSTFYLTKVKSDGLTTRKATCGRCSAREMANTAENMVERIE
jgi:hypothetical protein